MIIKIVIIYELVNMIFAESTDYCALKCDGPEGVNENTACKCETGSDCGNEPQLLIPDEETKQYIIKLHNEAREKVASGSTRLPAASNLNALAYDDQLQYTATCWAKQCAFRHDRCRRTEHFQTAGQNIFTSTGECDGKTVFKTVVDLWYSEIDEASVDCIRYYTGCSGHFTQLVWAMTTHVGCSRILANGQCLIACNYGPAGNMLGNPVYNEGSINCLREPIYTSLCKSADPITAAADSPTPPGIPVSPGSRISAANINLHSQKLIIILVTIILTFSYIH
ncbi:cysteine-rich secretory protein-related [Holotrichia oblita]|uniref:Cysteine-rich secretory protein-related n=1 Tax=Holotrichia oblita TaxID=644536 RepID=A0ACB9T2D1_HOLOL|nr:cysteine-rich secretory protein-related [Holotrichia oblita]